MGTVFAALATYVGGVQKRFGGGPMYIAEDVFAGLNAIFGDDAAEFKDVMYFLNSMSKAVGGDYAALGVATNILKQLFGVYDRIASEGLNQFGNFFIKSEVIRVWSILA